MRRYGRVALVALALVLLAATLDVAQWRRGTPLWLDEEMIALNARDRAFDDLAGPLWLGQSAPLGWLAATRAMLLTAGDGERALRFIPLLFGVATVAASAWVGLRWLGTSATAVLVALVTLGQWLSHFRFEVKHYSADAFWALLLPALAARALAEEQGAAREPTTRWTWWWVAAAAGHWVANGAALVTPPCAIVMTLAILRRRGLRSALRFASLGLIWLVSFGVHYELSLQFTHHSRFLRSAWSGEVPPPGADTVATIVWLAQRLEPLAGSPGGASSAAALWGCAVLGFAIARRRTLSILFASVTAWAFVLAALRLVPLYDRFVLWIVPALYVGIALALDAGVAHVAGGWRGGRRLRIASGVLVIAVALAASADILIQGERNLDLDAPPDANHAIDDRGAVAWLMARRQPGDAVLTTPLGWPAIWWYGRLSIGRGLMWQQPDGTAMYRVSRDPQGCGGRLRTALAAHPRILVYVGFPDEGEDFSPRLERELGEFARLVESQRFAALGWVAVFERRSGGDAGPPGCLAALPARRW